MEIWKKINDYDGAYEVSNLGRIRSVDRIVFEHNGKKKQIKGRILSNGRCSNGYLMISLCLQGVAKIRLVHRLVAIHFIDNPLGLSDVNHKDENKENNSASNLEWCSHRDNIRYGTNLTRRTETVKRLKCFAGSNNPMYGRKGINNPRAKAVKQFDVNGSLINTFHSIADATRATGISGSAIAGVCRKRNQTAGNFIWKYSNN